MYYQMDSARPKSTSGYPWPLDIAAALDLKGSDLAAVCWFLRPPSSFHREVYLPLRWSPEAAEKRPYQLVVTADAELREIYVSIAKSNPEGKPVQSIKKDEPLRRRFYPAERPIPIPLPPLSDGYYLVELGAVLTDGGSTTRSLLIREGKT
jgi:hypothetical protein